MPPPAPDEPDDEASEPWVDDPQTDRALRAAVPSVMPPRSLALYARWWQLEVWLRELVYVELRARYGVSWSDEVKAASSRQKQDATYTHMAGADNENPLAYLDYGQLLEIMSQHWEQFGYALLERRSWEGRQDELKRIRHRIGHMRKPHQDDLGRIEQTLRDLERGTFMALASYNERCVPNRENHQDPVTVGWVDEQHPTAQRLISHADRRYGITLLVRTSRRPWTRWPDELARAPGVLWHADFLMRDRVINFPRLWHDTSLKAVRPLLMHMYTSSPWGVGFSFSAADDPDAISDAIGDIFDSVLGASRVDDFHDDLWNRWRLRVRNLDYRVLIDSGWTIVDDTTVPITNFDAGGGVQFAPTW